MFRVFKVLQGKIEQHTNYYQYIAYGIVSFLGCIIFYFVNPVVVAPGQYENFYIRLIAALLSFFLIISSYWPKSLRSLLPWYWYITLTYNLSFFFTFMLLQNKWSVAWQMNELMALTLLIVLTDIIAFISIALIGISLAFCSYYIVGNHFYIPENITSLITSYLTILIFCVLFNYRKDKFYLEKFKFQTKIQALNKSLEQKVLERTVELNNALKVKTEFLNNISHEVRTPVSEFSVAASNLKDCWHELDKEQRFSMVDLIARSAERLKNITMHLVSATELQDAPKILNLQRTNLVELINAFLDEASVYTKEKNIKIIFDERFNKTIYVNVDIEAITQVIRHLIKNAVKYSPQDSAIRIKITDDKDVQILISDEGVGIPEKELKSIFEPFTQSSRTNTGAGGAGLGLDIARKVIEAHNGKIWAKNNKTKGASFVINLPIMQAASKALKEKDFRFVSKIPKTVLIVDDEELVLQALEIGLMARAKTKVFSALNGYEGIKILEKEREKIDAVVLDIMMPGINGIEVLKIIKQKWPDLKVIIHSGVALKEEQNQVLSLGAIAFLSKPYKVEKLLEVLDQ
ncbi:MAG: response regulator [Rickettsiales bacterium]|nr:response regulator [Rickettsiales bacterium]